MDPIGFAHVLASEMWGEPASKCTQVDGPSSFKPSGEYGSVVVCSSQKLDGLTHFWWVRPSMCEKIGCNEFIESGKILHEADYTKHSNAEDIEAGVSGDTESQATPWDPRTRIELVEKLLLFGCFYLQFP